MTTTESVRKVAQVLTVAGSDSGAGAGIQADLKVCAARGVYCASVITAVTAQNTRGVQSVHLLPPEFVSEQLKSVLSDFDFDVVKIGMLPSPEIVEVLLQNLSDFPVRALVVDPVMVSTSGHVLAGSSIISIFRFVLVKGGDLPDSSDSVDVYYDGKEFHEIENRCGFVSNFPGDVPRVDGQLAVARAFGDKSIKMHLSSEPYVTVEIIDDDADFLILASDGLWKVMSNQEAVDSIKGVKSAAKHLAEEAVARKSSEDISVVVVKFQ